MVSQDILETLKDKQQELSKRIDAITADFQKGRSADFAEQTTESENDQVLEAIRLEAKEELKQVNRAIQRAKDDEYGQCITCGDDINQARLKTLPYTDYCINCAS
ncbi:TraR/DksA family transcriptional regulator [Thalassotalea sp. M1531]|uniref:TraR/DksA family transcriptional regulator n=1 Tax=Thalassotalea algicola TaxID=2716224 RepID=A0A7Y0LF67_9GAMM|nr:TraR/DksA family transcriptional regulator [Thalassotalea algicola]NMP33112.1 TraR/DksA family transcriptional regulator [Thalassotalea algicola]